jgi:hypothetical protein
MSYQLSTPLPRFDHILLRTVERVIPPAEREEWFRAWQAELWHVHFQSHNNRIRARMIVADLSIGLIRDALWLRTDSWRRSFSGTAVICLASLLGLNLFCTLIGLAVTGGWHSLGLYLSDHFTRSLVAAALVVFVAVATASRKYVEQSPTGNRLYRIKRQLFFFVKMLQILLLALLLSTDSCQPLRASLPNTSDFLQVLCFVIFSLVGLRWTLSDQEGRCKQCLQSLAAPARVGRPSHNLLEWNGTELNCKRGHGLLSIPEIETSWCQSSRWVDQDGTAADLIAIDA